jgi:hypothetical protein
MLLSLPGINATRRLINALIIGPNLAVQLMPV